MTPKFVDLTDLTIHPAKKLIPDEWGKEDPRYISFVEDIRDRGIDQPLLVDAENRVLEGRRRLRAAKQLQLEQVPVIVRAAGDTFGLIVNGLVQRGHYNKSQLAYLTCPLMQSAFDEARKRKLEMLKNPNKSRSALSALPKTMEEHAERIGVGRHFLFDAQKVHALFARHPEKREITDQDGEAHRGVSFKEFYEARILDPEKPMGLGAVVAGIAGSLSTNGKAKPKPEQLELFTEAFDTLEKRFRYWKGFDQEQRAEAIKRVYELVAKMPDDLREELRTALQNGNRKPLKRAE